MSAYLRYSEWEGAFLDYIITTKVIFAVFVVYLQQNVGGFVIKLNINVLKFTLKKSNFQNKKLTILNNLKIIKKDDYGYRIASCKAKKLFLKCLNFEIKKNENKISRK